jgi:hypothetical protein
MALIFLPLALGLIPPNSLYGYRTARSLSSPELWREANILAGWLGLSAATAALLINLGLLRIRRLRPEQRQLAGIGVFAAAMLIVAGVAVILNG